MEAKVDEFVMPSSIFIPPKPQKNVIIIGPGLRRYEDTNELLITKCGYLKHKAPNVYWVEGAQDKYTPRRGDFVVGIITRRAGESFKVDIGAAEPASLSLYAFEGATKKQKPDVRIGDAIYAKVLTAHKEMEPDLVCVDRSFKANNMGKLPPSGFIMRVPISLVYTLLACENMLLSTFGKKNVFEAAIGLNGRVWINGRATSDVLKIVNSLSSIASQSTKSMNDLCRRFR